MTLGVLVGSVVLALVAALGVLRPFRSGGAVSLDRLTDPLEDERQSLLRALRDLEDEHATGLLPDPEYRSLRSETEDRAVAVLRALESRDGAGQLAVGLKELRDNREVPGDGGGDTAAAHRRTARRRTMLAVAVGAAIVAVVVPLLAGAVGNRGADQSISGNQSATQDPLAFYQDRVKQHPKDPAARLDLAQRYLELNQVAPAIAQYLAVLQIEPGNPEARSTLGFLLFKAGKPQDGLDAVNQALQTAPNYPEALYFKGLILLQGLHQPDGAAAAFRAYLSAAPFGSRRTEVQQLLRQAESGDALPGPSPTPSG